MTNEKVSLQDVVLVYIKTYKDMGYGLDDIEMMVTRIFTKVLADCLEMQVGQ